MDQENTGFDLVETMKFDPGRGIPLIERHMERLGRSAAALGFAFDSPGIRLALESATTRHSAPKRIRLLLSRNGSVAIEDGPLPAPPREPVAVALTSLAAFGDDVRLRHKTTDRTPFEQARSKDDCYETIFADSEGFLTQGSFTSIFLARDGTLLTPPISRAIVPGVLRAELLATGHAIEAELRPFDVADGLLIGNAVRGLIEARLVEGTSSR